MGNRTFWKSQYGKELTSAKGTLVAATRIWSGTVSIPDEFKPHYPQYNLGLKARNSDGFILKKLVDGITLDATEGSFTMLPMLASIILKGGVTATEQTTGKGDYLWDFTPSLTATGDTLDSISLEYGDDDQAYVVEYVVGKHLNIKGTVGADAPVAITADCFGRQKAKHAFTGSLAPAAQVLITPTLAKLYKDAAYANAGTTEIASVLRSFEIDIVTGTHPKFLGNTIYFAKHGEGQIDVMLRLQLEGGAAAVALWDAFQARTKQAYQLDLEGPDISSGGKTHSLKLNLWADVENAKELSGDIDGNTVYDFVLHGLYDGTSSKMFDFKVSTSINAI